MIKEQTKIPILSLLGYDQSRAMINIYSARFWSKGKIHITHSRETRIENYQPTLCNNNGMGGRIGEGQYPLQAPLERICRKCLTTMINNVHLVLENLRGIIFNRIARLLQPQDIILICHSTYKAPSEYIRVINVPYALMAKNPKKERTNKTIAIKIAASRRPEDEQIFTQEIAVYDYLHLTWIHNNFDEVLNYIAKSMATEIINHFGLIGSPSLWEKETEEGLF